MVKNIDGEWLTIEEVAKLHERLVHHALKSLTRIMNARGIEYEDAYSTGMIGLIKAYRNFNPDYGYKFSTYAVSMITGEVQRFIRDFNPGVKFTRTVKDVGLKIKQMALENEPASVIAETLNVSLEKVKYAMDYLQNEKPKSLSDVVYSNRKGGEDVTIEEQVSQEEDFSSIFVQEFLNTLSEREQKIVILLMKGYTQEQIGQMIGITQVQVSRLLQRIREQYIEFSQGEEGRENMAKITKEEYEALKKQGKTDREIAEQYGIKQQTITYYKTKWSAEEAREKGKNKNDQAQEQLIKELKQQLSEREVTITKLQNEVTELKRRIGEKDQAISKVVLSFKEVEEESEKEIKKLRAANEYLQTEIDRYMKKAEESQQQSKRVTVLEKKNRRLLKMLVFAVEGLDD